MYINDIVRDVGSNIRLFADDTSLFTIVDNPVTAADSLNIDLNKISKRAATWLVSFNPAITEILLFSSKLHRRQHPPLSLFLNKHLGLYFTNDCTWHNHINYIKEKAWHRLKIMRKFKFDRKSLEIIYLTLKRPLLEHEDVIFDDCTQYEKNRNRIKFKTRIPRNAVSRLPALFHRIEVNL